ncbi:acyltransferase family protein [Williamsia herbipolensis]|uniref:acyltransferase family protein n=1 Tax=Williamsia herbipolensis TaxID=1603258 RepID=UPI0009E4F665|nr:acyltransferase [Williamsia herbipolensis]
MAAIVGSDRPHIRHLTGLRAIAAFAVITVHYQEILYALAPITRHATKLINGGGLGVMVFFTLSGFIIAYTYLDRLHPFSWPEYGRFMWARFARMYPIHLTVLLGILVLWLVAGRVGVTLPNPEYYRASSFAVNLALLQGAFPANPWNAPAWTLTYEMAAYIAFPLLAALLVRIRSVSQAYTGATIVALAGTGALIGAYSYTGNQNIGGPMFWIHVATEFACGALMYVGWQKAGFGVSIRWDVAGVIGAVALAVVLWERGDSITLQLAVVPLAIFSVMAVAGSSGPLRGFLSSRPLEWLGRISFSLYLLHVTCRSVLRQLIDPNDFVDSSLVVRLGVIILFFGASVVCGALLYHLVEEPARKWLRNWLARRTAAQAAPVDREATAQR